MLLFTKGMFCKYSNIAIEISEILGENNIFFNAAKENVETAKIFGNAKIGSMILEYKRRWLCE